jgi:Reverse transcriptase (RNA-dependent DNA polymerase).
MTFTNFEEILFAMIDQSFSAENFEKIFNIENRKGNINRDTLPLEYISLILKTKETKKSIVELQGRYKNEEITKDEFLKQKDSLNEVIKGFQQKKENVLYEDLKKISDEVNKAKFRFSFNIGERNGKPTYEIGNSIAQFYAIKQLQYNLRKTFKVKQSDRYRILKQIKLLLSDGFPKILIRTDIESFYESIPQNRLLELISGNTLLTHKSKLFISQILGEYEKLKNKEKEYIRKGVPRGVGLSAYLSELYMRDIDSHIKSIENVTFYARYVDDIFIVITPQILSDNTDYLQIIKDTLSKYDLTIKESKTERVDIIGASNDKATINYLGYSFEIDCGVSHCYVKINLTANKIDKYKGRLKKAFDHYNTASKYNEKTARRLLFNRLRFLSANTKLLNSKAGIKVGVYYSNSLLEETNLKSLSVLNGYIMKMVCTNLIPHCSTSFSIDKLKAQIVAQFNFCDGFRQKRFHSYTTDQLIEIKKIWKDEV